MKKFEAAWTRYFNQGKKAFKEKKNISDCPYKTTATVARTAWRNGWHQASKDVASEKIPSGIFVFYEDNYPTFSDLWINELQYILTAEGANDLVNAIKERDNLINKIFHILKHKSASEAIKSLISLEMKAKELLERNWKEGPK